jgi:RND family efflux transporter MFP subunit
MRRLLKIVVPLLVLVAGGAAAYGLYSLRPQPERVEPEPVIPLVRALEIQPRSVTFTVRSQGTVRPRTESTLVAEVAGRVIEVSPSLASGRFVEQGELLLVLDQSDYKQAVIRALAQVEQVKVRVAREVAEAQVALKEWRELRGDEPPNPLSSRELQVAEAKAALAAAEATRLQAEIDLERTRIHAPYAGRVREKQADLGQFVTRGQPVVQLYAVDRAEVRLPLPDSELAFVDLPLVVRGESRGNGPAVTLRAEFAGRVLEWNGIIDRTEGEIDPRTRMVHAVAVVEDPYGSRPPLAAGMYVDAEIVGREVEGVVVIPRAAMRGADQVLVIDEEDRLRFRDVDVLRVTRDQAIVGGGLAAGERICLSPLSAVTDGMRVRTGEDS